MDHPNYSESDPKIPFDEILKDGFCFKLPENYMEDLRDRILDKVLAEGTIESMDTHQFELPSNYFQEFPNRIMQKIEEDVLPASLKENPFKLPANYFPQTAQRIMEHPSVRMQKPTTKTRFRTNWILAAAACMFFIISWFGIQFFNSSKTTDLFVNASEEELLEYVSAYADDFDQSSIAAVMSEDEVNAINIWDDELDEETSELLIQILE